MFFLIQMIQLSLEIWMLVKLRAMKGWISLKQERLITPVLKFGEMSHTIWKVTYGP